MSSSCIVACFFPRPIFLSASSVSLRFSSLRSPKERGEKSEEESSGELSSMPLMEAPGRGAAAAAAIIAGVDLGALKSAMSWWDEIEESALWQQGIYYALCVSYALVSLSTLVQLIRLHLRTGEVGWTSQKLFLLLNFILSGLRVVLFGFYQNVFLITSKALEIALLDLPGLLFFSTYTLLVLFWAELYYQARDLPSGKLRPLYLLINATVYIVQICVWFSVQISLSPVAVQIAKIFLAVVCFFASMGFLIYGGRLFMILRRFPVSSPGRQKKLTEIGFITLICTMCFLIRSFMVSFSAFDQDADLDVLDHPIVNFIFYFLVEIVPAALVLFILRKLPPKRVSDKFHPIS